MVQRVLVEDGMSAARIEVDETTGFLFLLSIKSGDDDDSGAKRRDVKGGVLYAVPLERLLHSEKPLSKKMVKAFAVPGTKGAWGRGGVRGGKEEGMRREWGG